MNPVATADGADFVAKDHLAHLVLSLVRTISISPDPAPLATSPAAVHHTMMTFLPLHSFSAASTPRIKRHFPQLVFTSSGSRCAGFPHHLGFPQAASASTWQAVWADFATVREGRSGEARSRRARWYQDQSQCVEAQGDELRAYGTARRGAGSAGRQVAQRGRSGGCRGGQAALTQYSRACPLASPPSGSVPDPRPRPIYAEAQRVQPSSSKPM